MNWLSNILQLVAVIAAGIHQVHVDKTLGDKQAVGQDILATAIAGATVALPKSQAELAASISAIAQTTLAGTIAALHNAAPVPNPAP